MQFYEAVLDLAIRNNNEEIANLLLVNENIDITIKDSKGKNPIDYAENGEIKKLLLIL